MLYENKSVGKFYRLYYETTILKWWDSWVIHKYNTTATDNTYIKSFILYSDGDHAWSMVVKDCGSQLELII